MEMMPRDFLKCVLTFIRVHDLGPTCTIVPSYNANSPGLIAPLLWQARQTVSALCQLQPAT